MVVIRNRIANSLSGGPRQFTEIRNKFMARLIDRDQVETVREQLNSFSLDGRILRNSDVMIIQPMETIGTTLRIVAQETGGTRVRQAIEEVQQATDVVEASIASREATRFLLTRIEDFEGVANVDFVTTKADFGPENLRLSPFDMPDVDIQAAQTENDSLGPVLQRLGVPEAWNVTRGENAIVAIFDTGYAEDLIDSSRIVDTFHGDMVDSVFASGEGHGTMCAGAAAANSDEGVPFSGAAPDAGVILVRITDDQGQISSEIIADAWDWITERDFQRPIISNHSYGTPLCSGRPKARFCNDPLIDVIEVANESPMMTSVYAAGNEAMQCGHRPSGLTNAITGTNSIESVIAVGALLTDGREAQRYSSHGRGDCAPVADPKPNVSCAIPRKTYYGVEDGWKIKDMSTGLFGSGGGTSHAAPTITGMLALIQSAAVQNNGTPLDTEEIKLLMEEHSTLPHANQINRTGFFVGQRGHDARFGFGQFNVDEAIQAV